MGFCIFCRTHLALSDISCDFFVIFVGHIWLCWTYLAGTDLTTSNDIVDDCVTMLAPDAIFATLKTIVDDESSTISLRVARL